MELELFQTWKESFISGKSGGISVGPSGSNSLDACFEAFSDLTKKCLWFLLFLYLGMSYRTYLLEYREHFLTAIAILSQWKCSLRKWFLLGRISHPLRPKIESLIQKINIPDGQCLTRTHICTILKDPSGAISQLESQKNYKWVEFRKISQLEEKSQKWLLVWILRFLRIHPLYDFPEIGHFDNRYFREKFSK